MIGSRLLALALAGCLAFGASPAWSGTPTDQLKRSIEQVVRLLEDRALKEDGRSAERRTAISKAASDIFDFAETARRSLARHWQGRTDAEREEFITLFGDLLERSYISKIDLYGGERISYTGESVDGDLATVRTKITTRQGTEVPVDYRMFRRDDRWLVYDVSVEGISLVSNYRTQFNRIIQTSSYQELVKRMKSKQEEIGFEEQARVGSDGRDKTKKK